MKFIDTKLTGVKIIKPIIHKDERGYFFESFRANLFNQNNIATKFVQVNRSSSKQGVLRGLHYQYKHPQGKLISVLSGCVYDVAVDIDPQSPTFCQWVGIEISAENKKMFWIAPGYAHGFYVLSDRAEFLYQCTDYYYPEYEKSIAYNDSIINIAWPLIDNAEPILSKKDRLAKNIIV